jgi:PAS domain S-box-containing protein
MEENLRQGEARYRAVIEQATDGIYLLDAEARRFVESNPSFQQMFGYTPDEVRKMDIYDLVAHARADVDATIERTLESGQRIVGERKYRRKDGALLDVEVGVSVIALDGRDVICTIVRDVTERRQNEEALRTSEAELRALFEAMTDLIFVIDGEGRHLKVAPTNPSLLYRPSTEITGKTLHDIFPSEQADEFLGHVRHVLQTRRSVDFEYGLAMDRGELWFEATVSPMLEDSVVWVARDVTGRKRDEEALARSESRLRQIIETEPECVKVLGMDGSLLEMNSAGLAMIEADSLEQVRGKSVYSHIAPEHRASFVALTERVLRGGSGTLEFELIGLKGTRRWLDTHAVPLRVAGDEISGLLAITRDITERKEAEQALRQSERLYRVVIEQATENIFLIDVETRRIVESNRAFRESLGYSEEELHRMTLYDVVSADRESVDANIRQVLEQRDPSVGERKYLRKDGSLMEVEVSASVILRDGRRTLVAVAHDVTERARMQRLLEERVSTLSGIAASLTLDLPVENTLDVLARSVVGASTAVACAVALLDEETGALRMEGFFGLPAEYRAGMEASWKTGVESPTMRAVSTGEPVIIRGIRQFILNDERYASVHHLVREATWDIIYIVPLISRGRALGAINLGYLPEQEPEENEKVFLKAVADQAAVAVENARLFTEARGKAALEERQRLARELHDSVSQALYGIALGAETARELLRGGDPERARDPLDYTISLAEAGMTEMRALIFELRPESLETEGLVVALEKQAAAIQARHGIKVKASLCSEPVAPFDVKEALYRVAQEALHNVVKHAQADNVEIEMGCLPDRIEFEISDDGVGFDARSDFPGHLGLRSMRERTAKVGGALQVDSSPGCGARIRARLPL